MLKKLLVFVVATLVVLCLFSVTAGGFVLLPVPSGSLLFAEYQQAPLGRNFYVFWLGFGIFLLFNVWPLALILVLSILLAWVWSSQAKDEEITAYLEHSHSLEMALRQAREQADFAGAAWEVLNTKIDELFHQTAEMMLVVHPINGIRRYNPAVQTMAKRVNPGLRNLEGLPLSDLFSAAELLSAVQRAHHGQQVWQGDIHLPHLNQWFLVWVLPLGHDVLIVMRDVTGLHQADGFQQSAELVLRQVIEESVRPVALVDAHWHYLYHSFKWPELLGLTAQGSLIGKEHWAVCPHFPANKSVLMQQLASGQILGQQEERTVINGQEYVFSWFIRAWKDAGGGLGGYVFGVQDVSEFLRLKQQASLAEERENQLAYADALTGLPNRQLFNDRLNVALAQAYRNLSKIAVLFLDLDGFKGVNDKLGHAAGDVLLKQVAERLKGCVRNSDTLARLGGDEFTIILSIREPADAEVVAQKILAKIREPYTINGEVVDTVGTSIGVALYPQHGAQAAELMKAADNAMYAAKEAGKNTYRFATVTAAG